MSGHYQILFYSLSANSHQASAHQHLGSPQQRVLTAPKEGYLTAHRFLVFSQLRLTLAKHNVFNT